MVCVCNVAGLVMKRATEAVYTVCYWMTNCVQSDVFARTICHSQTICHSHTICHFGVTSRGDAYARSIHALSPLCKH